MSTLMYPIKYAPLPFYNSKTGTLEAFAVAKCYLLAETKIYSATGRIKEKYKVVFQWGENEDNIVPCIDSAGNCNNSQIVDAIFSSFYQCQTKVNELNAKVLAEKTSGLPIQESTIEYSRISDIQKHYNALAIKKENDTKIEPDIK